MRDPKLIVLLFNEYINQQDLQGLSTLMADNYVFIDSDNDVQPEKVFPPIPGLSEPFFEPWIKKRARNCHWLLHLFSRIVGGTRAMDSQGRQWENCRMAQIS
jgi:hypothetical protein